ncbi:flagellin N-terminal helical domain-containing protein [Niallia sp. MER TA 168]|uniref:flagellin N-terminal helical domain-containing protein n=1 Tax=Niallia sp. MER TA 168 TaxID=2939568 RepID=UPI00203A39CD|nr:flagellin [Niallia sp. MER TA 168]MCM3360941.1 flagellin [Niallia sp. MER TA 168]
MRINHNIAALNTYRQLNSASTAQSKSMEKLSSGLRINNAADDAAGLAISEKMRGQIRGLDMASKNAQDTTSLIQTAEGALNETHSILQRMRELSVQSANDTNTVDDRKEIQKEINQLVDEIDRIGNQTEFNTKKLLNGGAGIQGNTNNANVAIAGGTDKVKAGGQLVLTGVKAASTGSIAFTADDTDSTFAAANGTFSINGVSISIASTDTASQFLEKVNAVSSSTGVTASGTYGGLTFTTAGTGSNSKIDISGINNVLATAGDNNAIQANKNGLGASNSTGTESVTGLDARAVINGGTTGNDPTSVTASGNTLTFHGGDYDGLELNINSALGTVGTAVNVNITANNSLTTHIGSNNGQTMSISMNDMRAAALFVNNLDVTTQAGSESAITSIDNAIKSVSAERSKLGAYQNRLDHTINNLNTSSENLTAAESRIRDVDYALAA